jgi:hypothetical protein
MIQSKTRRHLFTFMMMLSLIMTSVEVRADFWGGDLVYLAQILQQAIQQVQQLQGIMGVSRDSLNFMRDINRGLRDAMSVINTMNQTLKPGNLSNLNNVTEVIREIQDIYGRIPVTSEAKLQTTQDLTVAESIQLHNDAFRYADLVDPEAERIKDYAKEASPLGAAKTSLEAQGILIHVLNQLLRTNAAILKIQSENLAMQNRKSKMQSEAFRQGYGEISRSLQDYKPGFDLPSLSGNH